MGGGQLHRRQAKESGHFFIIGGDTLSSEGRMRVKLGSSVTRLGGVPLDLRFFRPRQGANMGKKYLGGLVEVFDSRA